MAAHGLRPPMHANFSGIRAQFAGSLCRRCNNRRRRPIFRKKLHKQ